MSSALDSLFLPLRSYSLRGQPRGTARERWLRKSLERGWRPRSPRRFCGRGAHPSGKLLSPGDRPRDLCAPWDRRAGGPRLAVPCAPSNPLDERAAAPSPPAAPAPPPPPAGSGRARSCGAPQTRRFSQRGSCISAQAFVRAPGTAGTAGTAPPLSRERFCRVLKHTRARNKNAARRKPALGARPCAGAAGLVPAGPLLPGTPTLPQFVHLHWEKECRRAQPRAISGLECVFSRHCGRQRGAGQTGRLLWGVCVPQRRKTINKYRKTQTR